MGGKPRKRRAPDASGHAESQDALLRRNEERLRYALSASSDGLWDWDVVTQEVYLSPRWKAMLGYADDELENQGGTWARLTDPADLDRITREAREFAAGRIPKFEVEFRMRHKAGHWVEILSRAAALRDAQGQVVRLIGTHTDITARKQAEEEIRQLNAALEKKLQDRSLALTELEDRMQQLIALIPAGIVIHGADGRVVHCNPAAQKMLSLTDAEAAGKGLEDRAWHFLRPDGTTLPVEDYPVSQVLARRASVSNQIIGLQRNPGQAPRWGLLNADPRFTRDGQISEVIVGFMDISDCVWTEAALRDAEARLRLVIETVPAGIVIHGADGRIVHCNPAAREMLSLAEGQAIGMGVDEPAWLFLRENGTPMPREEFPVAQVLAQRRSVAGQIVGIQRGLGRVPLWAFVNAEPRFDAQGQVAEIIVGFMDISERVGAEAALRRLNQNLEKRVEMRTADLRESETRFRTLAEASFEGIVLSRQGLIEDCNDQLTQILGYSREEIIGRHLLHFVPSEWQAKAREAIARGTGADYEGPLVRKDGRNLPVEIHGRSPWGPKGLRITVVRDNTLRKRTEAELEASRTELERNRRVAEISEISAGIVHQIGQPVSAIAGNIFVFRKLLDRNRVLHATLREVLTEVEADLQRIRDIMSHLRSLVQPLRHHREEADLNQLAGEVLAGLRAQADARQVHMQFDASRALPKLKVDRVQVSQIIRNLVENAMQATVGCPPDRRTVTITTCQAGPEVAELAVQDSGRGIPAGEEEKIFEPFYGSKPDGMGIGLCIARSMARAHGGQIECRNNHGGAGATFTLRLPTSNTTTA